MSDRSISLAQRRSELMAHCAVQRAELARTTEHIEACLGPVDRGIDTVRRVVTRPAVLVGGLALLAVLGPKRMFSWAGRAAVLVTTGRRLMRLVR